MANCNHFWNFHWKEPFYMSNLLQSSQLWAEFKEFTKRQWFPSNNFHKTIMWHCVFPTDSDMQCHYGLRLRQFVRLLCNRLNCHCKMLLRFVNCRTSRRVGGWCCRIAGHFKAMLHAVIEHLPKNPNSNVNNALMAATLRAVYLF